MSILDRKRLISEENIEEYDSDINSDFKNMPSPTLSNSKKKTHNKIFSIIKESKLDKNCLSGD